MRQPRSSLLKILLSSLILMLMVGDVAAQRGMGGGFRNNFYSNQQVWRQNQPYNYSAQRQQQALQARQQRDYAIQKQATMRQQRQVMEQRRQDMQRVMQQRKEQAAVQRQMIADRQQQMQGNKNALLSQQKVKDSKIAAQFALKEQRQLKDRRERLLSLKKAHKQGDSNKKSGQSFQEIGKNYRENIKLLKNHNESLKRSGKNETIKLLPPPKVTGSPRRGEPGVASHGGNLPTVGPKERWLKGSSSNAGKIPHQIAVKINGKKFSNFDEFRKSFWMEVAKDPVLSSQFSFMNRRLMARGLAPYAIHDEQIGKRVKYEIDHMVPLSENGNVYDMNNLIVRTPLNHMKGK